MRTKLVAEAHFGLARTTQPSLEFGQIYDCTSGKNQRIEVIWSHLQRHALRPYLEYFKELERKREWKPTSKADVVALIAVYMPIVRQVVSFWVKVWNGHTIRKDKKRLLVL